MLVLLGVTCTGRDLGVEALTAQLLIDRCLVHGLTP
jgi:hypothetical protein